MFSVCLYMYWYYTISLANISQKINLYGFTSSPINTTNYNKILSIYNCNQNKETTGTNNATFGKTNVTKTTTNTLTTGLSNNLTTATNSLISGETNA